MNCPQCNIPLLMTDRKGVEIDYCGQCRGVWLDRGELDKIIELSVPDYARNGWGGAPPPHTQGRAPYSAQHSHERSDNSLGRSQSSHERSDNSLERSHSSSGNDRYNDNSHAYDKRDPRRNDRSKGYYKHKKRKSLLEDIFDIFD